MSNSSLFDILEIMLIDRQLINEIETTTYSILAILVQNLAVVTQILGEMWREQGSGGNITVSAELLVGLIETTEWAVDRAGFPKL
jgi:hypothetical protein